MNRNILQGPGLTYNFSNVPATVLASLHGVLHSLIYPEMPVEMVSFFPFAFFCGLKSSPTCRALVWVLLV